MIRIRRIAGESMSPRLRSGEVAVFWRPDALRRGSVVLVRRAGREVVKRVESIDGDSVRLIGDNRAESTDSRHYGPVNKSDILGVIMISLPRAVKPPKPVWRHAPWLGRGAALVLVAMALVHLFRIDTFIPILDEALPGGSLSASLIALLIIMSEVFAIPFALRMQLSPLAHVVSGMLLVFAPLWWALIAVWSYGFSDNIGQLGEFAVVAPSLLVVMLNIVWIAANLSVLYALGFSSLKLSRK